MPTTKCKTKQNPKLNLPPHLKMDREQGPFSLGKVETCCKAF